MQDYEELRIRIWKTGRNRYMVSANGLKAASAVIHLPQPPYKYRDALLQLLDKELWNEDSGAERTPSEQVEELGRTLFEIFFPQAIRGCLKENLRLAQGEGKRLRLRLDVAPELMDIPFEILWSPAQDPLRGLALHQDLSLVRSLKGEGDLAKSPRLPQPKEKRERLRLLVIVSSPRDHEALNAQQEIDQIRQALPSLWTDFSLQILGWPNEAGNRATRSEISSLLESQEIPCAVLLIAHGSYSSEQRKTTVLLERDDGSADPVTGDILKNCLAKSPSLRLVILNLCLGAKAIPGEPFAGLAQTLVSADIPAVVAMQTEVSDTAALTFSPRLVEALCENRTIDEAVLDGRLQMAQNGTTSSEWCAPVIFLHENCGHGWLFKVPDPGGLHPTDPLEKSEEILQRVNKGNYSLPDILSAGNTRKWRREWKEVQSCGQDGVKSASKTNQKKSIFQWFILEARTELCRESCQEICERLAREEDPQRAEQLLERVKSEEVRPELLRILTDEVLRARSLWDRFQAAARGEKHAGGSEDWRHIIGLCDKVLEVSPEGYKDTIQRREVAIKELEIALLYEGEMLDAATNGRWQSVIDLCQRILSEKRKSYKETAAYRSYAEGRLAEEAKEAEEEKNKWSRATESYQQIDGIFLDVHQRFPYARGRAAELNNNWKEAASCYTLLLPEGFEDSDVRYLYAQAKAAELEELWKVAIDALAGLDPTYREAGKRRLYALGRLAEEEETWRAVIAGFGDLPDLFEDVGLRRNFARAKVAESDGDYKRVVEDLRDVPDEHRDGEAGWMRNYAQGRLDEARSAWLGAVKELERAGSYRDAPLRRRYALGRQAEKSGDWEAAAAAFAELSPDYGTDVAPRLEYARGRLAEEVKDWPAAVEAFSQFPDWPPDTGQRLACANAHWAEAEERWQDVLKALQSLETAPYEIPRMRAYAQARLAEEGEDWADAAGCYVVCGAYADAPARGLYAQGRRSEIRGSWRHALESYERLADEHRDAGERRRRLERLLDLVPWVDGLADAGLIADPAAGRDGVLPYEELRKAGVHPGSPAEEVKDASFILMARGAMTPEARLAWDRVRSLEGRLKVDAFLYRLRDPEGLRRVQQNLLPGAAGEVLQAVCRALPGDTPLILLLDGRREPAIEAWETLRRQTPEEAWIAHALALACFWRACDLEASGAYEQAEAAWERSIAEWALVLSDDAYWAGWRQDRAARYRQVVTQSDAARLRSQVGQELLNTPTRYADDYAAEGRRERAERYRQLALSLEAELEGARALKEVGGLPLGGDGRRNLVCGPLYLRHAGLGRLLGERIARLEAEAGGAGEPDDLFTDLDAALGTGLGETSAKVTPDALYRLRCAFSELGKASLLLERHQPEQAIQALPSLYRTKLSELPADCGRRPALDDGGEAHLASCAHCQDFLASNPGYLCLPHRRARLLQDAVELATRACLNLAQTALTTGREGCEEAIARWRDAIEVSRNAGAQVRTKRAIVRVVLGRADALDQERGRQRGERLTEAIELIEKARELIGGADEGQLAAKAAEVLTDRGVWYGNGGYEEMDPDFERAAQDLRRALELTPGALHALDNLSRALIFQAANLPPSSGSRRSFELFAEALSVLNEGLRRTDGHRQLLSVLAQALDELDERVLFELSPEELSRSIADVNGGGTGAAASLAELADEKLGRGDEAGALRALIAAVRRDAGDDAIRGKLLAAVERKASLRS